MQTEHDNSVTTGHNVTQEYIDSMECYINAMLKYIAAEREYVAKLAEELDSMRAEHLFSPAAFTAELTKITENTQATSTRSREEIIKQRREALTACYHWENYTRYRIAEAAYDGSAILKQLAICEDKLPVLTERFALYKSLIAEKQGIRTAIDILEAAKAESTL